MKSEFEFIETIQKRYSLAKIGDDCAVLPKDAKTDLVITTDLLVEDIDFKLEWSRPEFIGHKALAVSLSDIAAMGAKPIWAMLSIGVPEKVWKTDFVDRFYDGWFKLAKNYNVELIGGDVSRTPDKIVVDSIAAGETERGKAVLRSGARAGDLIFVTGYLGGASGGLKLLFDGISLEPTPKQWQEKLIFKQLKPQPQIAIGKKLGTSEVATAMIDLSDGLSGDLRHICRASRVGAKIFADRIPVDSNLSGFIESHDEQIKYAVDGGEDFELLFTVNPNIFFERENFFKKHGFINVGEVTANVEMIELIADKNSTVLEPKSFRHF